MLTWEFVLTLCVGWMIAFCPDTEVSLSHKQLRLCKPNVICASKCKTVKYSCLWKRTGNDSLELFLQGCPPPAYTRNVLLLLSFAKQLTSVIHWPTLGFKVTGQMHFHTYVNDNIGLKRQANQWPFTNNRPFYWKSLPGFWACQWDDQTCILVVATSRLTS